jgi:hypothetical protein
MLYNIKKPAALAGQDYPPLTPPFAYFPHNSQHFSFFTPGQNACLALEFIDKFPPT